MTTARLSLALALLLVTALCCVVAPSLAARTAVLQVRSVLFLCMDLHERRCLTPSERDSGL